MGETAGKIVQLWRCRACGTKGSVEHGPGLTREGLRTVIHKEHDLQSPRCLRPDIRLVRTTAAE